MNILDWIAIAMIVISGIRAYYRGFLYTGFQTVSTMIAIFLSYVIYKPINIILRQTFIYNWLQKVATGQITINGQSPTSLQAQSEFIHKSNLPIPNMIKENLIRNNNPEVYKLLGASDFKEYIGGYIANFFISMIAFMIVWSVVKALIYLLGESLHIIGKLPIINIADRWLGLGLGFIKGALGIWIITIVMAILIPFPKFHTLAVLLNESLLAKWFYENNLVLAIIDQLFV